MLTFDLYEALKGVLPVSVQTLQEAFALAQPIVVGDADPRDPSYSRLSNSDLPQFWFYVSRLHFMGSDITDPEFKLKVVLDAVL